MDQNEATKQIQHVARNLKEISLTKHAKDQMLDRNIIMGDVLHALKYGNVFRNPQPSTLDGYYKCRIESVTPNSNGRSIGVVVVPSIKALAIKIITVMWIDETATIAQSKGMNENG